MDIEYNILNKIEYIIILLDYLIIYYNINIIINLLCLYI